MADDPARRPGLRVLDLSTPRPPGEAPPEPEPAPETPAAPAPRGPAPVVGQPVDLSTGKPPSKASSTRTNNPAGLRVVVQKTINLSTPKADKPAAEEGEPRSRRGTRPDAATGTPRKKGATGQSSGRGGPKGRTKGGRQGGAPKGQAPRSASTGLADFLDPETLKRLRGEG